ncbi:MAG TPA: response regulator [Gemmata sp.]
MADQSETTILLVDDSEDNRYAVNRHLQRAGFRIVQAENGEETLRLVKEHPDLVILDIDLPDMNGFEVCHQIKANPVTADIPILHLSGTFTKTRHRVQGLDGGADAYLCHPVEPLELIATVNALLRARRAEEALREANRRKDDFLAMLAHELRNPLAPIRNAVEILRLHDHPPPGVVRSVRDIVDRQATHMARLVDDLLDVTRIARGKVSLQKERCDLNRVVRETVDDYRGTVEANGLALHVRVPEGPVWVSGDRTRLSQVVGNLLNNAVKFTDRGGEVHVDVVRDGEGVVAITVRDTGIGIDAGTMKTLFEPFAQADRSLDRSRGGLGLGLALVKGLAGLHEGGVTVASDGPGRGTTLTVRLPLARPAAAPAGEPAPAQPGAGRHVLIVEDNRDSADSLFTLLEMLGHKVAVAYTGPDGAAAARRSRPEVMLCDIGLPGMDGYAVARAVREQPAPNDVYLIALTGYGRPEDVARAHEAGFDAHLTKPVVLADLQRVLAGARGAPPARPV